MRLMGTLEPDSLWLISIHAPRERCDQILFTANTTTPFSIHVPLARYDALGMATVDGEIADFNPHTARAV